MVGSEIDDDLKAEAQAFNARMAERLAAGLIPDLRRAVKCDYFYKSFWRDPYYVQLYLGDTFQRYLRQLQTHAAPGARVLDAGCGGGHFALELARNGYHVVGIDIADRAVQAARDASASNPFTDGFGSLEYRVMPIADVHDKFDAVLFSGVLHHISDVASVLDHVLDITNRGGLILGQEPTHELWRQDDAAQVALMRGLLSLTGHWYEPPGDGKHLFLAEGLGTWVDDIHTEYLLERDKSEPDGQSPHDLSSTGAEIMAEIGKRFQILEEGPMASFLYRMLGGLRGNDETTHRIADFLVMYERVGMERGFLKPNGWQFIARKKV
jgi:2-polyprenyl-3-methyl-5-hydroxy-6-metoxy-1,4-benzoquinol methylase